jgi:hypothetical protein
MLQTIIELKNVFVIINFLVFLFYILFLFTRYYKMRNELSTLILEMKLKLQNIDLLLQILKNHKNKND